MKCLNCAYEKNMTHEKQTIKYDECGLKNVVLVGVDVYTCPNCGETFYNYGNIMQLHKLISETLLKKEEHLTGPEIKFLRKHAGFSKEYFASILGVDERTVYRWESGKNINSQIDRSIRMAVVLQDRDYNVHDYILQKKTGESFELMKILFKPSGLKLQLA